MTAKTMLIDAYFKQLKMPQAAKVYRSMAREAQDNNLTYEQFLLGILEQEITQREQNALQRRIRLATFPIVKTLDTFEFMAVPSLNKPKVLALAEGDFIKEHENLIMVGNAGTGKTHLATAIAYSACRKGYRVKFYTAAGLVNELLTAQHEYRLSRLEKQWLAPDLVILDELGFVPFSKAGAELLFQYCSARYERGSLIITTNLEFAKWTEVFGDEQLTAALLDRLTHRSHILNMNGESYRFRQSLAKQTG